MELDQGAVRLREAGLSAGNLSRGGEALPRIRQAHGSAEEKTQPRKLSGLGSGDVILTRSLPLTRPLLRTGLTVYPRASQQRRVLCSSRTYKAKCPMGLTHRAFGSGDVLLSHGLPPYYHRDRSVSLPCSEWERVGPLRYSHQKPAPIFGASFWCVIRDWLHRYNGCRLSSALTF